MFKLAKFKKKAQEERLRIFELMKTEKEHEKWLKLKAEYDAYDSMENPRGRISKSDIFAAGVSLVSILTVLYYEDTNVVRSKAFSWLKLRKI